MKWHKISDGDYPKRFKRLLVCRHGFRTRNLIDCFVASMRTNEFGEEYWHDLNIGNIIISDDDRWAYIDLPTD